MFLRAAATLLPRPRPGALPTRTVTFTGQATVNEVAAYDAVCGFALTDRLPPTYPHILAFAESMRLMSAGDFPFPVVGLVHTANTITQYAEIPVAARLSFEMCVTDLRPHRRGRQFDLLTTASLDGVTVWRETSTYLRKEGGTGASVPSAPQSDAAPQGDAAPEGDTQPLTGEPVAVWRIPSSTGTDYARVSGDRNPIHTSWLGARAFGFPRPIAHGMWSLARVLAAVRPVAPFTVNAVFKAPIFLGGRVALRTAGSRADLSSAKLHLTTEIAAPL
ncbi:MaoC family dehydratase [Hamadaea tsunoensis]|uniref:MaoC family dehydratase n=1 Tax=Hamadaea tsunoensis TaxID=53368 RepID=UPI000684E840|nr:MaoC/PaaZ C-terminal domain-containing protein [Hamadaea tsunoensis]